MLFICIVLMLFIICIYIYYKPSIDIIYTSNSCKILLWYNEYMDNSIKRDYIHILEYRKDKLK